MRLSIVIVSHYRKSPALRNYYILKANHYEKLNETQHRRMQRIYNTQFFHISYKNREVYCYFSTLVT